MPNELETLIAEQAADMAGTRPGSHDRPGWRERDATAEEAQAAREAILAHARFRTRRHRRIYAMHVAGLSSREIARRFHLGQFGCKDVQAILAIYNRQRLAEQAKCLDLDASALVSWRRYSNGRERASDRPIIERILAAIRALPQESPCEHLIDRLPAAFRARWRDAGLSEDSTPSAVLKAAREWPELAEYLRLAGIVTNPFEDAAVIPTQSKGAPCSS